MDLAIRNGAVIDGNGGAAYRADVGVKDGRIVAIGVVPGQAAEEIDAGGAVVAPGFIDVHTHYDAQVLWDPMLSPSVYHGVTTVLAGNCGFTLAPLSGRPEDADYLLGMLSKVEGMPIEALEAGVKPSWRTFGEYLEHLDGTVAVNAAFMVGHSAIRRHVMGDRAVGHEATPAELEAMCALLRQSLAEGGVGFSTTVSTAHVDHRGQPVPSRWANREELLALARVVSDFPGTWLEMVLGISAFSETEYELATQMALAAQRPLNWNLLVVTAAGWPACQTQLAASDYAAERGAKVYALVAAMPNDSVLNFRSGNLFEMFEGWLEILVLPYAERLEVLADPAVRKRMQAAVDQGGNRVLTGPRALFENYRIIDVRSDKNAPWKGRLVGELAEARGVSPLDAMLDLTIEEDLWASFSPPVQGNDPVSWGLRGQAWRDDRCIIGGSDAGAHLDMINTFALSTQLLGEGVRRRGLLTLEDAVRRITSLPCDRFGLKDRGRLAVGAIADIVVFDPDTIDCGPIATRNDLPQSGARLYADSVGVHHVVVGGVPVAKDNTPTGRRGGKVLRSGRDTVTAPTR